MKNLPPGQVLLYLLATDTAISDEEAIRIYGIRWKIETFFQAAKSLFKLGEDFQTRSYDSTVSTTALVFTRYIVLEWIRRHDNDPKTYGGLFFLLCEDVQDMELSEALASLLALFVSTADSLEPALKAFIKNQLAIWIASQSWYIQGLFSNLRWES